MRRFHFKLATVLKVKNRAEEERQRQLQHAETRRLAAGEQLFRCQEALAGAVQEYQYRMKERFDRYLADDYRQYVNWLNQQLKTAAACLRQCEAEVARARQCLVSATQEREILDKLRERAYQQYQRAQLKTEINFLDELGTGRFIRRTTDLVGEDR
jgi:flagellar FliJ protein